jgi:hypothetical protein
VITAPDSSRSDSTRASAGRAEMLTLLGNDWLVAVFGAITVPDPSQLKRRNSEHVQNCPTDKNWPIILEFQLGKISRVITAPDSL